MNKFLILGILFFSAHSYSLTANLKVMGSISPQAVIQTNEDNVISVSSFAYQDSVEKIQAKNKPSFLLKDWGSIEVRKMENIEEERYYMIVSYGI